MFIKPLAKAFAGLMAIYSLIRALNWFVNRDFFVHESWRDIAWAFVVGFRFDLAIISGLSLIVLPLIFVPLPWLRRQPPFAYFVRILFTLLHSAAILSNLIDIEFINTTGRRLTVQILGDLRSDIGPQLLQLVLSYAYIMALWLIFTFAVWRLSAALVRNPLRWLASSMHLVLVTLVLAVCYRGGWQPKVLHPAHANSLATTPTTAELALNGPFHFLRNPNVRTVQAPKYFSSFAAAREVLNRGPKRQHPVALPPKTNVVIFVIESLSAEYMGDRGNPDYTPFLSGLRRKGASFFGVASSGTSIEALAPILLGVPSVLPNAYITSMYQNNRVWGIGSAFKSLGYDTSFFHGGQKGTMFFDSYAKLAGIEDYFGLERYPDQNHFDGGWGIYDHYFLEFMASHLQAQTKPFLSVLFTLSSHPPYPIPPDRAGRYPKGPLRIHESLGYVDEAFKEFFAQHAGEPWFDNTLFVFTADHTQTPHDPSFMNIAGRKNIPIFFYHPTIDLGRYRNPLKVIQQADIAASVYDLLGKSDLPHCVLSRSVFNSADERGSAIFKADECTVQVEGGSAITYYRVCDAAVSGPYDFVHDGAGQIQPPSESIDRQRMERAKADTQIFFQGIIENRLFD